MVWPFMTTKKVTNALLDNGPSHVVSEYGSRVVGPLMRIALNESADLSLRESAVSGLIGLRELEQLLDSIHSLPHDLQYIVFSEVFASLGSREEVVRALGLLADPQESVRTTLVEALRNASFPTIALFVGMDGTTSPEIKRECRRLLEEIGKKADAYLIRICLIEREFGQSGGIPVMDEPTDTDMFVVGLLTHEGYALPSKSPVSFKVVPMPPSRSDVFLGDIPDDRSVDELKTTWHDVSALCVGKNTGKTLFAQGVFAALYFRT